MSRGADLPRATLPPARPSARRGSTDPPSVAGSPRPLVRALPVACVASRAFRSAPVMPAQTQGEGCRRSHRPSGGSRRARAARRVSAQCERAAPVDRSTRPCARRALVGGVRERRVAAHARGSAGAGAHGRGAGGTRRHHPTTRDSVPSSQPRRLVVPRSTADGAAASPALDGRRRREQRVGTLLLLLLLRLRLRAPPRASSPGSSSLARSMGGRQLPVQAGAEVPGRGHDRPRERGVRGSPEGASARSSRCCARCSPRR